MSNKKNDSSERVAPPSKKRDTGRVSNGYMPIPTSERAPAPPPKNP